MIDLHGNIIDPRTITEDGKIRLFVYGTLMHDFGNAPTLSADYDTPVDWMPAVSVDAHYIMAGRGFPMLAEYFEDDAAEATGVAHGELVAVELEVLDEQVDPLEGHPKWYTREPRQFTGEDGVTVWAYVYLQTPEAVMRHGGGMIYAEADFRKYDLQRYGRSENVFATD